MLNDNSKRTLEFTATVPNGALYYSVTEEDRRGNLLYYAIKKPLEIEGEPIWVNREVDFPALDFDLLSQFVDELDLNAVPIKIVSQVDGETSHT